MRQGAKLFGSSVSVAGRRLKLESEAFIETPAGRFREDEATDRSGARSLIWSRYQIAGRRFVEPIAAQLWYGLTATVSNPSASLIGYRAACGRDANCTGAHHILHQFVSDAPNE